MAKPAFNATQPRFNYIKDEIKRSEVPGPGSYGARYGTQEPAQRSSPNRNDVAASSGHYAIFKDKTSRDDFRSYMAHEMKKPPVAPTDYF